MNLRPKKSLGQNFLIDSNILDYICHLGKINNNSTIIEIGPGTGNLTEKILLQNPKEVIVSYQKRFPLTSHLQLGYSQQVQIAKKVADFTGDFPIVINAKDVLMNPKKVIMMLCDMINIDFEEEMLSWPSGKRDSDGVWAPHWYSEVEKTTAFQPYSQKNVVLDSKWKDIFNSCMADYKFLNSCSIKAD